MPRTKRKRSDAEREERRRGDRERLTEATRALLSSEGWTAWLRARATLHPYSLRNTLLIAQEGRRRGFTPTYVAGFKAWLKLGRCVRGGERGIAILAPVRVKELDGEGEETGESRVFFRPPTSSTCPRPSRCRASSQLRSSRRGRRSRVTRTPACWSRWRPSPPSLAMRSATASSGASTGSATTAAGGSPWPCGSPRTAGSPCSSTSSPTPWSAARPGCRSRSRNWSWRPSFSAPVAMERGLGAGLNVSDMRYPRAFLQALSYVAVIGGARFRRQAGHGLNAGRDDCASSRAAVMGARGETLPFMGNGLSLYVRARCTAMASDPRHRSPSASGRARSQTAMGQR
jgi:N-terminal domain of anti-restriction factor ArdC